MLDEICQNIGGDWLLLGGSLITLTLDESRGTQDIDLVRISDPRQSEEKSLTALFHAGHLEGLGPENLNTAAGFFLKQIEDWQTHLVLLQAGTVGRIFRPDFTLYVLLKLNRGTEIDLKDVKAAHGGFSTDGFDDSYFSTAASSLVVLRWQKLKSGLRI